MAEADEEHSPQAERRRRRTRVLAGVSTMVVVLAVVVAAGAGRAHGPTLRLDELQVGSPTLFDQAMVVTSRDSIDAGDPGIDAFITTFGANGLVALVPQDSSNSALPASVLMTTVQDHGAAVDAVQQVGPVIMDAVNPEQIVNCCGSFTARNYYSISYNDHGNWLIGERGNVVFMARFPAGYPDTSNQLSPSTNPDAGYPSKELSALVDRYAHQ